MEESHGYNHHDFEEHQARHSALEFEKMLAERAFYFIDLMKVDEIYQYYLRANELTKAQRLVHFAMQSHPANAELSHKLARLELEAQRLPQALQHINQAISLAPFASEYLIFKADLLARMDEYQAGIQVLEELFPLMDRMEEIYLQMGNVAQICGRAKKSEAYYREALRIAPDFEDALYELAFLLESEEDLEAATRLYEAYLDDFPYSAGAWYNLGILYQKLGNFERAIDAFDYALLIEDEYLSAYFHLGQLHLELNDHHAALRAFLNAQACHPFDIHTLYHLADCFEHLGMYRDAVRYYHKAVAQDPDFVDAWMGLGYCMEKQEKFLLAINYYQKAFKLDDEHPDLCLSLAVCEYKLGNKHSAYVFLERAIRLNPHDVDLWRDWAQLLYDFQNFTGAITYLEEGIHLNPELVGLYYHCAAYCLEAGFRQKGFAYLQKALELDFDSHYQLFLVDKSLKHEPEVMAMIAAQIKNA